MKAINQIESKVKRLKQHQIFSANDWFDIHFKGLGISAYNYYKVLERFVKEDKLHKISKGLYYKPRLTQFGFAPMTEDQIIHYFLKSNKGFEIGYGLYYQKKLTTQLPRKRTFYLENARFQRTQIKDLIFIKPPLKLKKTNKNLIEVLDVLENLDHLEDINLSNLKSYLLIHLKEYSDKTLDEVQSLMPFKKSTLSKLKRILDEFGFENSIEDKYLSQLSRYKGGIQVHELAQG